MLLHSHFASIWLLYLAPTTLAAFGVTKGATYLDVDTGNRLVFRVSTKDGDIISLKYGGKECQYPREGSHIGSGLPSASVSSKINGNRAVVTVQTPTLTHYYIAVSGQNSIYMGTHITAEPAINELRFIARLDASVLSNGPIASNARGGTTIEGTDVFLVNGQTRSKFASSVRFIDDKVHGVSGNGVGAYMVIPGNAYEKSSGGPFFRDINNQNSPSDDGAQEVYWYMNSNHAQTEAYRMGFFGPYALVFTPGAAPSENLDTAFYADLGLKGYLAASGRGTVSGSVSGVPSGFKAVVGLKNADAQYWGRVSGTSFSISGVRPGTYTATLFKNELEVGTGRVTVTARNTATLTLKSNEDTKMTIWQIGVPDGTPAGFLNADKIETMHPSDKRMSNWGPVTYTIGSSKPSSFPMAQFIQVNNPTTIKWTANSSQIGARTLRIRITWSFANARPVVKVNSWTSAAPAAPPRINSRGVTRNSYRGHNHMYVSGPKTLFPAGPSYLGYVRRATSKLTFEEDDAAEAEEAARNAQLNGDDAEEELYRGIGDEEESEDLLQRDPKDWKNQDHYAVMGLSHLRYKATQDQIKVANRKKVLKHHPDKKSGLPGHSSNDDAFFKCVAKAFEVLSNPEKRRQFDSVDPYYMVMEDEVPTVAEMAKKPPAAFFKEFGPIFEREARFSKKEPVPMLGAIDAPKEEVENFYNFWYNFDSWRSFEYLDKEVNEGSDNRDEKRYAEKKNRSERARRKKDDNARLRTLVDTTMQADPRIKRIKQEEKEAREAKKRAKSGQPAGPTAEEKRKAEEEEKRKAEEAKVKEEAEKADAKKAKAAAANAAKKARRAARAAEGANASPFSGHWLARRWTWPPAAALSGVLPAWLNLPDGDEVKKELRLESIDQYPLQVLDIPGYANWTEKGWNVRLHGSTYKIPTLTASQIDDAARPFVPGLDYDSMNETMKTQARNMTASILTIPVEGVYIRFDFVYNRQLIANANFSSPTNDQGEIDAFVPIQVARGSVPNGNATDLTQGIQLFTNGSATGNASSYFVPTRGITLVTDVDDILRVTKIYQPDEGLRNSFVYPFRPWMNMPDLFRRWQTTSPSIHFHYLTTIPIKVARPYMSFIYGTYPLGSFDVRPQGVTTLDGTFEIRKMNLQRVFETFPSRKFVLLGDTSNADVMQQYPAFAAQFRDRVQCILMRNTSATDSGDFIPYDTSGFKDLDASTYMFFRTPDDITGLNFTRGDCRNSSVPQNVTFQYEGIEKLLNGEPTTPLPGLWNLAFVLGASMAIWLL
ncbi:Rhamnogalacturonate lyase [Ceratobasidium theobromae]|uniref:rhamnogalacturonan endolyase n=1 Tax=Ceratobasidium theobromae TaxID=1582974 RepID=A0A5N5QIJ0_9AGAM|nr:Rhamnogalacturonate lyase [Ceratobasidium theobromae]